MGYLTGIGQAAAAALALSLLPAAGSRSLAMTRELARARLLTVAGYGHTALFNPSTCAGNYEAAYLISGALPPPGTVCQQDQQPFG